MSSLKAKNFKLEIKEPINISHRVSYHVVLAREAHKIAWNLVEVTLLNACWMKRNNEKNNRTNITDLNLVCLTNGRTYRCGWTCHFAGIYLASARINNQRRSFIWMLATSKMVLMYSKTWITFWISSFILEKLKAVAPNCTTSHCIFHHHSLVQGGGKSQFHFKKTLMKQ